MKSLSLAMLLTGTIIGAGFASGREILSFFGQSIPLYVAPLCGVAIFLCAVLFLSIGSMVKKDNFSEVNQKVLGKAHVVADVFLLFNSLVVLAGMLACIDSLFSLILPIAPTYSIAGGALCAAIVSKGIKGLFRSNAIVMPIIIIIIVIICCCSITLPIRQYSFKFFSLPAIIIYVGLNMMLASTVFTTISTLTKKQIIVGSALAGLIIATLMQLIILALNSTGASGAMPLMQIALSKNKPLFYISFLAIATSIFTTMMAAMTGLNNWLRSFLGGGKYCVVIVLLAGLIVSNLGFENVVAYLYPVIGVLGILYIFICMIFFFKNRKKSVKVLGTPTFKHSNTITLRR